MIPSCGMYLCSVLSGRAGRAGRLDPDAEPRAVHLRSRNRVEKRIAGRTSSCIRQKTGIGSRFPFGKSQFINRNRRRSDPRSAVGGRSTLWGRHDPGSGRSCPCLPPGRPEPLADAPLGGTSSGCEVSGARGIRGSTISPCCRVCLGRLPLADWKDPGDPGDQTALPRDPETNGLRRGYSPAPNLIAPNLTPRTGTRSRFCPVWARHVATGNRYGLAAAWTPAIQKPLRALSDLDCGSTMGSDIPPVHEL
jgi:hypothetical protein